MTQFISTETPSPGVLLVRLDKAASLNTLSAELVEELHGLFASVREDAEVRAIVLTGEGRAFCAGIDLKGYGVPPGAADGEGRVQAGMRVQEHIASLTAALRETRAPVIAAVNGPAYGGGMSLALAADLRLMAEGASFEASFIKRGQSACDVGLSWLLPRIVGFSRAADIMLTGRRVDAAEALEIGLASSVHPPEELLPAALAKAAQIAEHSPFGVWMTKDVLWANLETPSLPSAIALENRTQILSALTRDHREAVTAFLEKRPPVYRNH
ncbi:enoyl-CoA hydratase-related protein [Actinocorallia aurea]